VAIKSNGSQKIVVRTSEKESFLAGMRAHEENERASVHAELVSGSALPLLSSHHFIPDHIVSDANRLHAYRAGRALQRVHRYRKLEEQDG